MKKLIDLSNEKQLNKMLIIIIIFLTIALIGVITLIITDRISLNEKVIKKIKQDIALTQEQNEGQIIEEQLIMILDKYFKDIPNTLPDDLLQLELKTKKEYGHYNVKGYDIFDETNNVKVKSAEETGRITAAKIAKEPEKYYGKKVTNYTSKNGQSDWKIFYSNGENIFLIISNYLENSKIDTEKTQMELAGAYLSWWNNAPKNKQNVDDNIKKLFKAESFNIDDNKAKTKCVASLLNTSNWDSFLDEYSKAEASIGTPTIEMWMESWNNLYKNKDGELFFNNKDNNGYYIGKKENPKSTYIEASYITKKEGYKNKLYYPNTINEPGECYAYWIASPSAKDNNSILYIDYYGDITYRTYSDIGMCLRPVVCLKPSVTVEIEQ